MRVMRQLEKMTKYRIRAWREVKGEVKGMERRGEHDA